MLTKKLKNILISFLLIALLWVLLEAGSFLIFFYILLPGCWVTVIAGALAVTLRFFKHPINSNNLAYTFAGCFNLALGLLIFISSVHSKAELIRSAFLFIIPIFIGVFILIDILFPKLVKS